MPINRRVARFNKAVANHFVGPVLSRMPGFGKVHHRGRKSGRAFTTPVKLFRRGEDIVITLPYGPGSDWVKNVLAAGAARSPRVAGGSRSPIRWSSPTTGPPGCPR